MPEVILPCPECGDDECLIVIQELPSEEWSVHCGCGHAGRYCASEEDAIKAHNALPRALTWTNEPPKVAGPYYVRQREDIDKPWSNPRIVSIKTITIARSEYWQFAGPIAPPVEG